MTKTFNDENIGVIEFAYNAWTGRFNARINGVQASRLDKRTLKVTIEEKTYITTPMVMFLLVSILHVKRRLLESLKKRHGTFMFLALFLLS